MKIVLLVILFLLAGQNTNIFSAGPGATGAQFLKIPVSARIVGMGSSFVAVADDIYSLHWNPAGLVNLTQREIGATYIKLPAGINYGSVGYAQPLGKTGAFGSGLTYSRTDVPLTDAMGNLTGQSIGISDAVLVIGYGRRNVLGLLPGLSLGANLKAIQQEIFDRKSTAFAVDLGGLHETPIKNLLLTIA